MKCETQTIKDVSSITIYWVHPKNDATPTDRGWKISRLDIETSNGKTVLSISEE